MAGEIVLTKAHVGKTVYCFPTGNNLRLRKPESHQVGSFVVESVARKYAHVVFDGWSRSEQVTVSGHDIGYNGGYIFFETLEDALAHADLLKLRKLAYIKFPSSMISRLSKETILLIAKEIGVDL